MTQHSRSQGTDHMATASYSRFDWKFAPVRGGDAPKWERLSLQRLARGRATHALITAQERSNHPQRFCGRKRSSGFRLPDNSMRAHVFGYFQVVRL
jgi:hypothetical protein